MQHNSRPPPISPAPPPLLLFPSLLSCTLPHCLLISLSPKPPVHRTLPRFIIPFSFLLPLLSLLLFTGSLSFLLSIFFLPRGPCFFACITHNYFHPSIICLLLFSFPTSPFFTLWQQPPLSSIHVSLRPPFLTSQPSGQLNVPPHTLFLLHLLVLSFASPSCCPPYQMSLKFGWACVKRAGTKAQGGGLGESGCAGCGEGVIRIDQAILPWAFCLRTISTIGLTAFSPHIHTHKTTHLS